jgi:hypothetical protein
LLAVNIATIGIDIEVESDIEVKISKVGIKIAQLLGLSL